MMPETYSITLKHDNGIDYLAPRTTASNVTMADGRTTEVAINEKADKNTDDFVPRTAKENRSNQIDPNETLFTRIVTKHVNCPDNTNAWYIDTILYTDPIGRKQLAYQYSGGNKVYTRHRFNNIWSTWQEIATDKVASIKANEYINIPSNTDFNTLITPGVYTWLDTIGFTNIPTTMPRYGKMIVSEHVNNGTSCLQEIIAYIPTTQKAFKAYRSKLNNSSYSWSAWEVVVTTDKVDISSNLRNGWTTTTGLKLVISGKMAHITGNIVSGIKTKNTVILDLTGLLIFDSRCSPTIVSFGQNPAFGLLRVDNGSPVIKIDNNWDLILSAVDNIYMLDLHIPIM